MEPSALNQLIGSTDIQSPAQQTQQHTEAVEELEPYVAQQQDKYGSHAEAAVANFKSIMAKTYQAAEALTPLMPGETQESRTGSIEAIKDQVDFNQAQVGMNIGQNPWTGTAQNFAIESLPYVAGTGLYQKGAEKGVAAFTNKFGNNPLSRAAGSAVGTAPVTAGIDLAQNRSADEMLTNQLFDVGIAGLVGGLSKPKGKPSEYTYPGKETPEPDVAPVDTGFSPESASETPYTGPDIDTSRSRKEMHIEPKNEVTGEVKDIIDRNNLDTKLVKDDLAEVFTNVEGLGKPNKRVQLEIEKSIIDGSIPKSKQGKKVLEELMAMPRYRNNSLSFIPERIATKLNEGTPLTKADNNYIKNNGKFLNEKQRRQTQTINDVEMLKSSDTPFDRRVELMNKYGDTDGIAVDAQMAQALKADPKALEFQLMITLDNIKKQQQYKRAIDEEAGVSGATKDMHQKFDQDAEATADYFEDQHAAQVLEGNNAKRAETREKIQERADSTREKKETKAHKEKREFNEAIDKRVDERLKKETKINQIEEQTGKVVEPEPIKPIRTSAEPTAKIVRSRKKKDEILKSIKQQEASVAREKAETTKSKAKPIERLSEATPASANKAPDSRTQAAKENPYYKATRSDENSKIPNKSEKDNVLKEEPTETNKDKEAEDLIKDNRDWLKKDVDADAKPIHGEKGAESLEYEHSIKNPAKIADKESTELFTKPNAKSSEKVARGYFDSGSVFMDTQMSNGKGFSVYTHESMHNVLSKDPYLTQLENAFREDYKNGNIPEISTGASINYLEKDPFTRYEESIIMVAADQFTNSLPKNVKERLGYEGSLTNTDTKYSQLTPNMKKIVDMLYKKADTALMSKGNELNQYAFGTDPSTMRKLDQIGYEALSKGIDYIIPKLKTLEKNSAEALNAKDYKLYSKTKEFVDELSANVMSQTSKLPAQEFIDKYTAIARSAEERGRDISNVVAKSVQEIFPDKKLREKLTSPVIRKDLQSVKKEFNEAKTYNEFMAQKRNHKKTVEPYLDEPTKKAFKQTVKGLHSMEAMNNPHWKANAQQVLMMNDKFRMDIQDKNMNRYIQAMDKYLSMEALTKRDFDLLKKQDQSKLNELIDISHTTSSSAKRVMEGELNNNIKGYKPSMFKKNIEFTDEPTYKNEGKTLDGWKSLGEGLYYREALPIEHIEGMMPSKNQMAKGKVDFNKKQGDENIVQYAEEHGYGLVNIRGQRKLRRIMSDSTRKNILEDNNDIAENLAAITEQTVHNKTTKDAHKDMAVGLNKNNLITGNREGNKQFTKMTPEELRMLPRELRTDLARMHKGVDNLYINKKYKEQMIGANIELSAIKQLSKKGIAITHKMLMNEAKALDMLGETTSIIKQKIILNNPVVITGNLMYGNVMAKMEGASFKDLKKFQVEAVKDFKEYNTLKSKQIELYVKGKQNTPEYQKITTQLSNNLAYKLFAEGDNTASGIDRNLLIKAVRESNLGKKHIEKAFTDLLGGADTMKYKLASELFMTPNSKVGSFFIQGLNYVDYMNRSTLMRTYMKQGMSAEQAARKSNSKTVSFSKRLPSSLSILENKGAEYFLGWALRNGVGVGKSVLEHPASWATFIAAYMMLSEEDPSKHDARYIGDVRVSSFNPLESLTDGWLDGGIYASLANDGAYAFEPQLNAKLREGKNPALTTRD